MELPSLVHSALGHQQMEVRVEVDPVAKCLDGSNHSGHNVSACHEFEITDEGAESRVAEGAQQPTVILEEYPQHFGDGEDDLAVGDIQEKLLSHPFAPLLQALGMARRTKPAGTAGEVEEKFRTTVRTADAGKPAAGVAAVEVTLDHLLDDRAEEAILLLETALILGQETIKVVKKHPVEDSPLRMSGTINSCHSRSFSSRNRPDRRGFALFPYVRLEKGGENPASFLQRVNKSCFVE